MSLGNFSDDPSLVKSTTNREGDGVGKNDGPQLIGAGNPAPYYEVSVKDKPGQSSSETITHTGPGAGVMSGVGTSTDIQGFVSATGNKVVIDNTFGSDTITMQHHSGATIVIDSDGSIHLISSGKKGVGVVAPNGDLTLYGKGHVILKGDGKVTLESEGDMDINVGGTLAVNVNRDMITHVRGAVEEVVQSHKVVDVVKELNTVVGGDNRITSAGKMRIQTPNTLEVDVGKDFTMRTDANFELDAQKKISVFAKDAMELNTSKTLDIRSKNQTKVSGENIRINSKNAVDLLGGALIQIKGTGTDIQIGGSNSPDDPGPAQLAQYPDANTILKPMTSQVDAPDMPINAVNMSAEEFSLYKNEGGNPNPKAEAYVSGNKGAGVTFDPNDTGITAEAARTGIYDRPAGINSNNGKSEQPGIPLPTSIYNTNEQLSRHVKVGNILNIHKAPQDKIKDILTQAQITAWNIIDPLIEKFGGRVYISSWYRDNSPNHIKGIAVDLRCANKPDYGFTAEMAAYIRDNLPYNRLFLEKNDEGGIHCHVEAAQPGQYGGGDVFTCADPHCQTKISGLQLSYAVAALEGRKVG